MDTLVSLQDYWRQLDRHDWYFAMSDDHRVYTAGIAENKRLLGISALSEAHRGLYEGFKAHHFSGKPWNTEKAPKPPYPEGGSDNANENG